MQSTMNKLSLSPSLKSQPFSLAITRGFTGGEVNKALENKSEQKPAVKAPVKNN